MVTVKFIFAIILGVLGIIANMVIYQQKNRKTMLLIKLCANALWSLHYFCLNAYSGAIVCAIGVIRESVFINTDKKWAKSKWWLILFLVLNVITGIITWKNIFNLFPCIAGVISVISFWIGKPTKTRILALPISAMFFTYNAINHSYAGMLNEVFTTISVIIAFIRHKNTNTHLTENPN